MKIIRITALLSLLTLSTTAFSGLSITPLKLKNTNIISPQVTAETLVYIDDNGFIWGNRGDGSDSFTLSNGENNKATELFSVNGSIYFIDSQKNTLFAINNDTVVELVNLPVSRIEFSENDMLVVQLKDSLDFYVVYQGNPFRFNMGQADLFDRNGKLLNDSNLCIIDSQTAVFKEASGQLILHKSGENQILDVPYDLSHLNYKTLFDSACYFSVYLPENEDQHFIHFSIESNGQIETVEHASNLSLHHFFEMNDKFFVIATESQKKGISFYEMREDKTLIKINEFTKETIHPTVYSQADNFWINDSHFFLYSQNPCDFFAKCTPVPPGRTQFLSFDSNFNLIDRIVDSKFRSYDLSIVGSKPILNANTYSNSIFLVESGLISESSLFLNDVYSLKVLGGNNGRYFASAKRKDNDNINLYLFSDNPPVFHNLTGLWYDPEYQNQGLSVQTGTRKDHSEYLFASLYLFKDGEPYWLAGQIELTALADSSTVSLYEFQGSSPYLDNSENPSSQQITAEMKLSPISCNRLSVQFQLLGDESTQNLTMDRIINTDTHSTCLE